MNTLFTSDAFFAWLIMGLSLPLGVLVLAFIAYLARLADNHFHKNQQKEKQ